MWAAWIVATIVQNNPKGQKVLSEVGIIEILLQLLTEETNQEVLCKVLSSISGIIRNNKEGQNTLENATPKNFFQLISPLLSKSSTSSRTKLRAIITIKHFCQAEPRYKDIVRQNDIIKFLPPLLEEADEEVRLQTFETLCSLVHQNRENQQICYSLSVDKIIAKRE